jgi:hypothetical protein
MDLFRVHFHQKVQNLNRIIQIQKNHIIVHVLDHYQNLIQDLNLINLIQNQIIVIKVITMIDLEIFLKYLLLD